VEPCLKKLGNASIQVRRAMASEKIPVTAWVQTAFGDGWAAECEVAFARQPIACIVAVSGGRIVGFACHETTCRNFFGPIGTDPVCRHQGVGQALLLYALHDMAAAGYAYAIIGGAGPTAFFETCVGAFPIPGSTPGIYRSRIN
jgi:ribosomal protein S18 acetylase RimI-like enzyme